MTLDELEAVLKKLAQERDSKRTHELQQKNFSLYLAICGLGNLAELTLRLIAEATRHDQW